MEGDVTSGGEDKSQVWYATILDNTWVQAYSMI